jgi:hypothetical protein
MRIRIRSPRDFWAGIVFLGAGGAFLVGSKRFAMGTLADIGPGFFPAVVASLLLLVGLFLAIGGLSINGPRVEPMRLRPPAMIIAALTAFGLLIDRGGLVLATAALVLIASAAGGRLRPLHAAILAAALIAIAIGVFRLGLGIQIRLWPGP